MCVEVNMTDRKRFTRVRATVSARVRKNAGEMFYFRCR